jgi:hypothetical protein
MVNTGEQKILEKRKVTGKDFQEIDKRIVREMLNLSKTGVEEVREKVKLSEGEIYLIMHPDTLGTYDQGEEVNKLNNKKYEEEFLKWFTTILDQNKKSLELGNDHVQPVFLMLEETRIETMRDLLEKIFGNHLSKYGLVMIPTKVNSGTISNEIKDYGHRVMKDFGFEVSDPDGRVFAYNLTTSSGARSAQSFATLSSTFLSFSASLIASKYLKGLKGGSKFITSKLNSSA